jgi:PKD repeat protein
MNNLKTHYMKKLIVLFLMVCSGAIYFIGSSCTGSQATDPGPSNNGCTFYTVPVADFTTETTEYFVGNIVHFTFTGKVGGPDSRDITYLWNFPGAFNVGEEKYSMNPIVQYKIAGTYSVGCTINNGCWSNKKSKSNYITIKDPEGE